MANDFDKLADQIKHTPFDAVRLMHQITLAALANSQKRTPVKTGTLRRSETTRVEAKGHRGFLGTNVKYAPSVHKRTPFFAEGIADSRKQIDAFLAQAGGQYLAEVSDI